MSDAAVRLAAAVSGFGPAGVEALAAAAPARLCPAICDRYRAVPGDRDLLARGLGMLGTDEAYAVLLELLCESAGRDAALLLDELNAARIPAPFEEIRRLLGDPHTRSQAIIAAGVAHIMMSRWNGSVPTGHDGESPAAGRAPCRSGKTRDRYW